jgi:hypothetical protein
MDVYAKGIINLTKLEKILDENDGLVSENEKGELELKININFYKQHTVVGRNIKLRAYLARGKTFSIGSADVDLELFKERML